jgi:hypothetical protein
MNEPPLHNQPKSFDIILPGNTPASPTSRPVIPDSQVHQVDPMINENATAPNAPPVSLPEPSIPAVAPVAPVLSQEAIVVEHQKIHHMTPGIIILIVLFLVMCVLLVVAFSTNSL